MLISWGSLGLAAADNGVVVNEASAHKCTFLSTWDNSAAFVKQESSAPPGLEACYQNQGAKGGPAASFLGLASFGRIGRVFVFLGGVKNLWLTCPSVPLGAR